MKLLLDENLSPRLVSRLNLLFPGLIHVRDVGLKQADDRTIWDWAKVHAFAIVTTDSDFLALFRRLGWPPKIVHIEQCDHPLRVLEDHLRRSAVRISQFVADDMPPACLAYALSPLPAYADARHPSQVCAFLLSEQPKAIT